MKKTLLTLAFLLAFGAALPVYAMNGHDGGAHQSSAMDHGSMAGSHDDLTALGEQIVDGVKGVAHLGDVRESMAEAGQPMTHHLQIVFTDLDSEKRIESGTAAVKVTTPAGEELPPQTLMGMEGHFGADLTLTAAGTYEFVIGTKLPDGKLRQFEFSATVK